MRLRVVLAVLLLATTSVTAQQAPQEDVEAVAQRYVAAMRAHNWKGLADLMHPLALAKFHTLLGAAMHSPSGGELRQHLFGSASIAKLDSLNDHDFYAQFIAAAMADEPDLQRFMDSAHVKILGHVPEAPDLAHVVYSLRIGLGPVSVSKPDVVTFKRQGNTWLALLRADIEIMAESMRQRFGS